MSIGSLAMIRVRCGALLFCAAVVLSACTEEKSPISPDLAIVDGAQLLSVSGNNQQGVVGGVLTRPLIVRVVEADGITPVPGAEVTWTINTGGGTVQFASRITAADGTARNRWTLGATPGLQQVDVLAGTAGLSLMANANTAPYLSELSIAPALAYTGFDTVTVHVSWRAQDADGVQTFFGSLPWVEAAPQYDGYCSDASPAQFGTPPQLVSGTIYNGVWSCDMLIWMSPSKGLRDLSITATNTAYVADTVVVEDAFTQNDAVGPVVSNITFTPARVITAQDTAPVTVTWRAIDPAGVGEQVVVLTPTAGLAQTAFCGTNVPAFNGTPPVLVSGTTTNGYWQCTAYVPQNAAAHDDRTIDVVSKDGALNQSALRATRTLKENDATGPVFSNIRFTPARAYTAVAGVAVTVSWRAVDPVGIQGQGATLRKVGDIGADAPTCNPATASPPTLTGGTIYDGTWQCTIDLPQDVFYAKRTVAVGGMDFANNAAGREATVLLTQNDSVGPLIRSITFTPARVYTWNGAKSVTVTWRAIDPVGIAPVMNVGMGIPAGGSNDCPAIGNPGAPQMVSGTIYDGVWSCTFTVPQSIDKGMRSIYLSVYDQTGNATHTNAPNQLEENDMVAPVISSITFTPSQIGHNAATNFTTVTWLLSDPGGISSTSAIFNDDVFATCNGVLVPGTTNRYRCNLPASLWTSITPTTVAPVTIRASDGTYNVSSAQSTGSLTMH